MLLYIFDRVSHVESPPFRLYHQLHDTLYKNWHCIKSKETINCGNLEPSQSLYPMNSASVPRDRSPKLRTPPHSFISTFPGTARLVVRHFSKRPAERSRSNATVITELIQLVARRGNFCTELHAVKSLASLHGHSFSEAFLLPVPGGLNNFRNLLPSTILPSKLLYTITL